MTNATLILLVIAIVAIAVAAWMYFMLYRTRRLRNRFGPEYDRTVEREHGRTGRAESMLEQRQRRVSKLDIKPLTEEERDRFAAEWRSVQEQFVDDPRGSVLRADTVVNRVMQARNYPTTDFEQRADDISVEHPNVVQQYRVAHEIAMLDKGRGVSTEELRRAMQHYRSLFEGLLETSTGNRKEVYR